MNTQTNISLHCEKPDHTNFFLKEKKKKDTPQYITCEMYMEIIEGTLFHFTSIVLQRLVATSDQTNDGGIRNKWSKNYELCNKKGDMA